MITADQILCHLIGDYVLQSDWQAQNKTKADMPALIHAFVYSLCFLPLLDWHNRAAIGSLSVIFSTHFFIDRYRLARYVVWAKNWIAQKSWVVLAGNGWRNATVSESAILNRGNATIKDIDDLIMDARYIRNLPWSICAATGYPPDRPAWMAVWLLIIADNVIHIAVNGLALLI